MSEAQLVFDFEDFFLPSDYSGELQGRSGGRRFLKTDCRRCIDGFRTLGAISGEREGSVLWQVGYWLEVKKDSVRAVFGELTKAYLGDGDGWMPSYVGWQKTGGGKRRSGFYSMADVENMKAQGGPPSEERDFIVRLHTHLLEDHYDPKILEALADNPGWIPNGYDGWFEERPKRSLRPGVTSDEIAEKKRWQ